MDLLKKEDGSTIIENLVGIIIMGLIVTLSFSVLIKLYSNPSLLQKDEAFLLASQEVSNCINSKSISDTTYKNSSGNLQLTRTITMEGGAYKTTVKVVAVGVNREIITLSSYYVKNSDLNYISGGN